MNRARLGFTLIEITVVLVILGVVAAVVAPALPLTRQPGDEEARSLARALVRAQRLAVERGTTVEFRLVRSSYALVERSAWGDSVGVIERGALWPSDQPAGAPWTLQFDPEGRSHGEALSFDVPAGGFRVEVDRWNGLATIQSGRTAGLHAH